MTDLEFGLLPASYGIVFIVIVVVNIRMLKKRERYSGEDILIFLLCFIASPIVLAVAVFLRLLGVCVEGKDLVTNYLTSKLEYLAKKLNKARGLDE